MRKYEYQYYLALLMQIATKFYRVLFWCMISMNVSCQVMIISVT